MEWLNKIKDLIVTLPSRVTEPSTWAGVGVVLLGLAIVSTGRGFLGLLRGELPYFLTNDLNKVERVK